MITLPAGGRVSGQLRGSTGRGWRVQLRAKPCIARHTKGIRTYSPALCGAATYWVARRAFPLDQH